MHKNVSQPDAHFVFPPFSRLSSLLGHLISRSSLLSLAIVGHEEELSQICVKRSGRVSSAVMCRPKCHDWYGGFCGGVIVSLVLSEDASPLKQGVLWRDANKQTI